MSRAGFCGRGEDDVVGGGRGEGCCGFMCGDVCHQAVLGILPVAFGLALVGLIRCC